MKALFKGIYDHFTTQYSSGGSSVYYPVHINVGGRFYNTEAPQSSATEPYITYNLVSNYNDETFNEDTSEALIQFNIFSTAYALTNITTTYGNLTSRFDGATFASMSSSYDHTFCKREFSQLVRSDDTWHYIVQYRMRISK
jgi:hypothetical protein